MLHIANFIRKYWVIIAIIVLYFFLAGLNLLPFSLNIFKRSKLLIDETPVVVKQIRELGELTTSEFYGEVYGDLNEVYHDLLITKADSIAMYPAAFYKNYSGLKEYMNNSGDYRSNELEHKKESEDYELAMNAHIKKLTEFGEIEKNLKKEIEQSTDKKEKRNLENRLNDLRDALTDSKKDFDDRQRKLQKTKKKYQEKRLKFWESRKRRNLVYIGRGWVKAGVDLRAISEDDIIIDEDDSSTIQILIDDPVILDADINPWFIHTDKKKIPGFEVFIAKTGSAFAEDNFSDKEVTALKKKCKDKLKQNAIKKGLLTNAEKSTVQTLENFFRLVGFQKVDVRFKSNTIVVSKED